MTFNVQDGVALAHFGHRNQRDLAGMPYVDHPLRVMNATRSRGGRPYEQIAAVLHDIVEDFKHTRITVPMLETFGVPSPSIRLIMALTQDKENESREDYIARIIEDGVDAVNIKLDDLDDNTLDWRLKYLPEDRRERQVAKYERDRAQLLASRVPV